MTRTNKKIKKRKSNDGSEVLIEFIDNFSGDADKEIEVTDKIDNETKLLALERIGMACADITKDEWGLTYEDRIKEIENLKNTREIIAFFTKWSAYKNNCVYVCYTKFSNFDNYLKSIFYVVGKMGL